MATQGVKFWDSPLNNMVVPIFWVSASRVLADQKIKYSEVVRVASGICPQPRTLEKRHQVNPTKNPVACYFQKYLTIEKTFVKRRQNPLPAKCATVFETMETGAWPVV